MKNFTRLISISGLLSLFLFYISLNAAQAQAPDSKGRDFWITFPENLGETTTEQTVFITGDVATTGLLAIPGLSFSAPFTITPGTVTSIPLPLSVQITNSDVIENKGIHITANAEVTVYGLNNEEFSTDAFLALPTDILGTEYINLGYQNVDILNATQLAIVGTANSTIVTIKPSVTTNGHAAAVPYTIILNQGQTYLLRNTGNSPNDLTGTEITSTKPVAVFGGHRCANIPAGKFFCDYVVEQLPPVSAWGREFVTVPLATRLNGDTFRFVASENSTQIRVNGTVVATLNRGQYHERIIVGAANITATKPILVAQYSNSSTFDNVTADPFMMLIPPFEQFLGNYTVSTPATGFARNFINVVAPTAAVGSIKLDGTTVSAASFSPIGSSGFVGAQLAVSLGSHTLTGGNFRFGAFVYGFNNFNSYGYPGGQSLSKVAEVQTIAINIQGATTAQVGTEHCLTATARDQNNQPVEGVPIDFKITGANSNTGFRLTDASGVARFCYTGTNAGTDNIVASSGTVTANAQLTWMPAACNLSLATTQTNVSAFGGNNGAIDLTVTGGTAPYTYMWSNGSTSQDISGLTAGTYTVTVMDAMAACTTSTSVTITQPAAPTGGCSLALTTKVKQAEPWYGMWGAMNGAGAIDLTVTGGTAPYTYRWNAGVATQDLPTAVPGGFYSVVVTDANGCTGTTTTFVGRKNDFLRVLSSHANVSTAGGSDGSIDLTVVGGVVPATYRWSNGARTEDLTGLSAGTYKVIVTDAFGRKATTTVIISEPGTPLSLSITHQNVSAAGKQDGAVDLNVVGGMGPYTYRWNTGAVTQDLHYALPGLYSVTVTDALGATATATVRVEVGRMPVMMARNPGTGEDLLLPAAAGLTAYPNPASDRATVNFSLATESKFTLDLYDIRGAKIKTIASGKAEANKAIDLQVDVADYAKGIYLLKLVTDKGTSSKRLMVE